MPYQLKSSLFDLILCISDAVDLISPYVADHHRRVAYLSFQLGRQYGLPLQRCKDLAIAAALHDIGAISLSERLDMLNFETEKSMNHSEVGYLLISGLQSFTRAAEIVRFHHTYWADGAGSSSMGLPVPVESHILHLADRVSVLVEPRQEVLSQVKGILTRVKRKTGSMFMPEIVDAFFALAEKDYLWFDLVSPSTDITLWHSLDWDVISLEGNEFLELARFFCRLVDFKSPYTAAHSSGVAACGQALAELAGFSLLDQRLIYLSGYLHDIGKLCVPSEILEKPSTLSRDEYAVMRHHSYYTNHILKRVGVFENIRIWSAYHHERLDGSGYPYHLKEDELPVGSRIIAIADVFTAITEDRPYREGLHKENVMGVLTSQANRNKLDARLVKLLGTRFEEISELVLRAESVAMEDYRSFAERRNKFIEAVR
ncbi:MAG TPA: HD domain-containing phosphohydrolase [Anaerolineales bacterium]|jgi:HD-GYP domain-containing protein (c-di-GMP phosphodiesterase class II)